MLLALNSHPRAAQSWRARVTDLASAVLQAPGRYVRHRQLLNQMAQMSDFELGDIGLTRHDVSDATGLGFGEDPTLLFEARRRDRLHAGPR